MSREALRRRIADEGRVTFRDAMDLALNDPDDGWYGSGKASIGTGGDFTTSPELSPVFGACVAAWAVDQFERLGLRDESTIVEYGAGKGALATSMLDTLSGDWPSVYERVRLVLVERSAPMRALAAAALHAHRDHVGIVAELEPDQLPDTALVVSNEFVDALPAHVVRHGTGGTLEELYVGLDVGGRLTARFGQPSTERILEYSRRFVAPTESGAAFVFEAGIDAWDWIEGATSKLSSGAILTFDYGDVATRVAGPHRPDGSLRAMRERRPVADVVAALFEADLTVDVNFEVLSRTGDAHGWTVRSLVAQEPWLIRNGAVERMARSVGASLAERLAMKALLAPGLGDRLKVLEMWR